MSRKLRVLIMIMLLILILTNSLVVNAAVPTVKLSLSSQEIKPEDTFSVILHCDCQDGIKGLQGKVEYDKTKMNLVSITEVDLAKWKNLGEQNSESFVVIHTPSSSVSEEMETEIETSADILKITFKVKDIATSGTTIIKLVNLKLDTDGKENFTKDLGTKELPVTIKMASAQTPPPTNTKEDNTTSKEQIGKTGSSSLMCLIVVQIIATALAFFKYNKYKKI